MIAPAKLDPLDRVGTAQDHHLLTAPCSYSVSRTAYRVQCEPGAALYAIRDTQYGSEGKRAGLRLLTTEPALLATLLIGRTGDHRRALFQGQLFRCLAFR